MNEAQKYPGWDSAEEQSLAGFLAMSSSCRSSYPVTAYPIPNNCAPLGIQRLLNFLNQLLLPGWSRWALNSCGNVPELPQCHRVIAAPPDAVPGPLIDRAVKSTEAEISLPRELD